MRGFFGKIPAHGDFVDRGLAAVFKSRWDEWLQHALAASRAIVGQDWLNVYLTSPVWRFVLAQGICGSRGWTGLMVPSVDRVGRYFPLTIAAATPPGVLPLQVITAAGAWFETAEALALRALEDEGLDADALSHSIEQLGDPLSSGMLLAEPGNRLEAADGAALTLPLCYGSSPGQGVLALTHRLLEGRFGSGYSAWWTTGSELVHPELLTCAGLPAPDAYAGMLTDRCAPPGWQQLAAYAIQEAGPSGPSTEAAGPEPHRPPSGDAPDAPESVAPESASGLDHDPSGPGRAPSLMEPTPVSSDDILADLGGDEASGASGGEPR